LALALKGKVGVFWKNSCITPSFRAEIEDAEMRALALKRASRCILEKQLHNSVLQGGDK